jgi:hypothetical protein
MSTIDRLIDLSNFKDIKGYEDRYKVSEKGEIYSIRSRKIMTGRVMKLGYRAVNLTVKNVTKNFLVHRLVAIAFIENPSNFAEVNHKDGNKLNNHVSNLEWCSRSANVIHAYKNKLAPIGSKMTQSKLTEKEVVEIRELLKQGKLSPNKIGRKFNVSGSAIRSIRSGANWRHVK